MTTLTLGTVILVLLGVVGPLGYGRVLALGGATASGAALAIGNFVIPTFYAVAVGAFIGLVLQMMGAGSNFIRVQPARLETSLLLIFAAWSTLVTLISPQIFDGMHVLVSAEGGKSLTAGVITTSNIAQIAYLLLGIGVFVFIARMPNSGPSLIGLVVGLSILLSFWRYMSGITGVFFPERYFDNSPAFTYIETASGGQERFRGIQSEPAGLAASALVAVSYMIPRAVRVKGWHRLGALLVAGIAIFLGVVSTSATFVVAGGIISAFAVGAFLTGFLFRRTTVRAVTVVVWCGAAIAAVWLAPFVVDFVQTTINQKVSSSSYTDRTGSDSLSYEIFLDTFGVGVGLGGSRAASFLPGLLSTTGALGAALFFASVFRLMYRGACIDEVRPVIWALVAVFSVRFVSGPDLSDTSGTLWISLGVLARTASAGSELASGKPCFRARALPSFGFLTRYKSSTSGPASKFPP